MTAHLESQAAAGESAYRRHFLEEDGRRVALLCAMSILFNLVLINLDVSAVRTPAMFEVLLGTRFAHVAIAVATIAVALRPVSVARYDAFVIGWGLATSAVNVVVVYSRPYSYHANDVPDLGIALLLFLFMPDRPGWRLLPGLLFSVVHVTAAIYLKEPLPLPVMATKIAAFVLVGAVGVVLGESILRSRRRDWQQFAQTDALARQHLELVNAKERLLATLRHEFRTPLNAIASSAALLGDYFERLDREQRNDVAARLRVSVDGLARLFDDLLGAGGGVESGLRRNPVSVDVRSWLNDVAGEVRLLHPGCVVRVSRRRTGRRTIDPVLTRLVVGNLVSNACKFAPGDARKLLSLAADRGALLVSMRDAGPGIPPEERERVFERFFRGGNAAGVEGTGMGLAIVRDAVDLLGGTIAVSSEPWVETRIDVRLPWLEERAHV